MTVRLVRFARAAFSIAAVVAFVFAVLPYPPQLPGQPGDEVNHMLAFATLGGLGTFSFSRTSPLRLLAGLAVFGAVIEFVQMIPMLHRDSDPVDWIADVVAAGVAIALGRLIARRLRMEEH